jgi:hypothetical protein
VPISTARKARAPPDLNGNVKTVFAIRHSCHAQGEVGATLFLHSKALAGKVLCEIACNIPFRSASLFLEYLNKLMKKVFCVLALSTCLFSCERQQARDEVLAQVQTEVPVPAEGLEAIEKTPTPKNLAAKPSPVESITPQSEASVTPTATETPILSPTQTPTPTISSTLETIVQTPEPGEKPVVTSKPRLRLNPLSTGTPFPQATVSAEFNLTSSPVTSPVSSETAPPPQKTATSTTATSSWIRNASSKKRANPSVSPSPSPSQ